MHTPERNLAAALSVMSELMGGKKVESGTENNMEPTPDGKFSVQEVESR